MSIDLNWETLTGGPDGQELAERIRDFIHTKFQSVPLPRFIKSVRVHEFQFGTVPPELELKDITDPLPDFYEENPDAEYSSDDDEEDHDEEEDGVPRVSGEEEEDEVPEELRAAAERRKRAAAPSGSRGFAQDHQRPGNIHIPGRGGVGGVRGPPPLLSDTGHPVPSPGPSPFLGVLTPGIPGGTTNMHYFHSQFASGTQTPLLAAAAVASGNHGLFADAHHGASGSELSQTDLGGLRQGQVGYGPGGGAGRGRHGRQPSLGSVLSVGDEGGGEAGVMMQPRVLREKHSVSTLAPTSAGTSRPPTRDAVVDEESEGRETTPGVEGMGDAGKSQGGTKGRFREPRVEDLQAVFRIRYAGDVKLLLTADILLDYPMPSFVGIPVRLSITGLTFDGVGVLAYIRKRAHFCFLSPEDAVAAVGGEENKEQVGDDRHLHGAAGSKSTKMGGLLQEIRVESEIGQREGGKQSLKNVGKVERFVLEQVRRIFEEEFVYPSFWTFLV